MISGIPISLWTMMDGCIFTGDAPNMTPIWGVEMDPETMHPKTERVELIYGNWNEVGYERETARITAIRPFLTRRWK